MIFRQSPGPCKAASVGGLAYRHIGYFIPLFIGHRERKALIARFFCKLTVNLSGMSPRGFEAPFDCPLGFRTCFLPLASTVARTKAGKLRK